MTYDDNSLRTSHERERLYEVLKEFDTLLLGTFEQTGAEPSLRARPMHVAHLEPDCTLYFITRDPSEKLDEALSTRRGHVFGQSSKQFVSMHGEVNLSVDRERIRALWKKSYEVWLNGPEDPHAVMVVFKPRDAELWDIAGAKGLRFLFESARALVTGEKPPRHDEELHERVSLNAPTRHG